MKIVHLSSVHQTFDIRIFHKQCKTLAAAGHEVVLVVQAEEAVVEGGVRVRPVPPARGRRQRLSQTVWQVYRAALDEDAAIYHFHDSELLPVGWLLKQRGKTVVYDVHEDLPRQILTKGWVPSAGRRVLSLAMEAVEATAAWWLDGLVAATPHIAKRFPSDKTVTVNNYPLPDELASALAGDREPFVVYSGGLNAIRGAREMVAAMALLPAGLRLSLAGSFLQPGLEAELRAHPGWRSVEAHGWVSRETVRSLLGRAQAGLVLFQPAPNHVASQPNKLFEYMSAELPVVASDFPLWREIVEGAGCGLLVDPRDPQAIADAIAWLVDHPEAAREMGRRGREAVLTRFNWATEAEQLLNFYETLAAPGTGLAPRQA